MEAGDYKLRIWRLHWEEPLPIVVHAGYKHGSFADKIMYFEKMDFLWDAILQEVS